jgi:hypothetical protein
LPQEGKPVAVQWKRSLSGKTVPASILPTSRASRVRKDYKLSAWLKTVQKLSGKLVGLSALTCHVSSTR